MNRISPLTLLALVFFPAGFATVENGRFDPAPGTTRPALATTDTVRRSVALARPAAGVSGALRVMYAMPGERIHVPLEWSGEVPAGAWYRWSPRSSHVKASTAAYEIPANGVFAAPDQPGVYELEIGWRGGQDDPGATLLVKTPYDARRNTSLNGYRIGRYPAGTGRYAPPIGLIEVTPENQDLRLSEHFRLREFLTKDQASTWPKYVIVDLRLLDKLELVMDELERCGVPADRMVVMSGYRTPQYNGKGVGNGRASLSRHQYGDAADVWIDTDGDWYMDDLNRDGRRDTGDARVMLAAVEAVERRYPELVGGAGIYGANSVHGPFIHIDTRGRRARWSLPPVRPSVASCSGGEHPPNLFSRGDNADERGRPGRLRSPVAAFCRMP